MTRRRTKLLWALAGTCMLVGAGISLLNLVGPPGFLAHPVVKRFDAFVDVMAVLLWLLVFAVATTWYRKE